MNINKLRFNRRNILKAAAAGALNYVAPAFADVKGTDTVEGSAAWRNWSGNQYCNPVQRVMPDNEAQLVDIVRTAQHLRVTGAGHSFSPLVPTSDTLLSLASFHGVSHIDQSRQRATVRAGTRLAALGQPLWESGLALQNMPDIDTQEIAGAVATSTHGTGMTLGSLSSTVTAARLVKADGTILECDERRNTDLLPAIKNHLGTLGVVSSVQLQLRPAFKLRERSWMMRLDEGLAQAETLRDQHRHFEMYALPHGDYIMGITLDETDETDKAVLTGNGASGGEDSAYEAFRTLSKLVDYLPFMRSFLVNSGARSVEEEVKVGRSYQVFAHIRDILFNEMEYSVPAEVGVQCLREVLDTIKKHNIDVVFPIEFRYVKGDDTWLSPFYRRDSCAISCHNFHDRDYKTYYAAVEPVFWKYQGRPHWGKINTMTRQQLIAQYPRWKEFQQLRTELDPGGKFLNHYLQTLFAQS